MAATHDNAGIAATNDVKTVDDWYFDSFEECAGFANTHDPDGEYGNEWTIASNVRLRFHRPDVDGEPHCFAIVLYETEIVRYYMDDTFSVDNGGYNTLTTSRRITQFTPDGYNFYHHKKKLVGPGGKCNHDRRFPNRNEHV